MLSSVIAPVLVAVALSLQPVRAFYRPQPIEFKNHDIVEENYMETGYYNRAGIKDEKYMDTDYRGAADTEEENNLEMGYYSDYDYSEQADVQSCKDRKALQSIDKRLAILEQTTIKQLAVINHKLDKPNIGCGCGGGGNGSYTCGGTGGWRRVVNLNMTNSSATCPKGWKLKQYSKRTCGISTHRSARVVCESVSFPISGGQYTQVCGKVKAYQRGFSYGFFKHYGYIDVPYMDGISVTHGGPRKHIWTFASGFKEGGSPSPYSCPCETTSTYPIEVPSFVGNDYFCDAARKVGWNYNEGENYNKFYPNNPLWDAKHCPPNLYNKCCLGPKPPYFIKKLSAATCDDIEVRLCVYGNSANDDIAVEVLELYVK